MISRGMIEGHQAIWLENETLRVTVLPEKGADIAELVYKPRQIDFLLKTPAGLRPPGAKIAKDFLENYEGGWQELFPNPGDAVTFRGKELPFHGLAALLPWTIDGASDSDDIPSIALSLELKPLPFRLERRISLLPNCSYMVIQGTVVNLADTIQEFQWGHHIVLGGNFLTAGCRMEMPACMIYTPEVLYEPETAVLAPHQCLAWPFAASKLAQEPIDLRNVLGPTAHTHDDIYLIGFQEGWLDVFNPELEVHFRLEWDPRVFGCLVNWRPFGGADMPPLTGIYGMGIEPWTSRYNLNEAVLHETALRLDPGQSLTTIIQVMIQDDKLNHD